MVGAAIVTYAQGLQSASVLVRALHRDAAAKISFSYCFASTCTNSTSSFSFYGSGNATTSLVITLTASDLSTITLEPVDFAWNTVPIKERTGDYRAGQKGAIVEFFGWPHTAVEEECSFLASAGYLGAKLFPVQEQVW